MNLRQPVVVLLIWGNWLFCFNVLWYDAAVFAPIHCNTSRAIVTDR